LTKSLRSIEKSLGKVAKKKFKDDPEVGLNFEAIILLIRQLSNKNVAYSVSSKNNQFSSATKNE